MGRREDLGFLSLEERRFMDQPRRTVGLSMSVEMAERMSDIAPRAVDIDEERVYQEMSRMLAREALVPEDYLSLPVQEAGGPALGVRENLYLQMRAALSHVMRDPTEANYASVGYAVEKLAIRALAENAVENLLEEPFPPVERGDPDRDLREEWES